MCGGYAAALACPAVPSRGEGVDRTPQRMGPFLWIQMDTIIIVMKTCTPHEWCQILMGTTHVLLT